MEVVHLNQKQLAAGVSRNRQRTSSRITRNPFSQHRAEMSRSSASISLRWASGSASQAAKQLVRLVFLHGGEVRVVEKPPPLKVTGQQRIGICRKKSLVE